MPKRLGAETVWCRNVWLPVDGSATGQLAPLRFDPWSTRVESIKYLGVTITKDLRWDTHVSNVCTKAVPALSRFGLGRFGPGSFRPNLVGRFGPIFISPLVLGLVC